jgi:hypothetical protein
MIPPHKPACTFAYFERKGQTTMEMDVTSVLLPPQGSGQKI